MSKGNYIDGAWRKASGAYFESIDPSNGALLWSGQAANPADVNQAFFAARTAFEAWAEMPIEERLAVVRRFKDIATSHAEKIANIIARETGKVLWDASGEAGAIAGKVDISIRSYHERTGVSSRETGFGYADLQHRPHGVMAVLGPYNFPAHLPNGQIIPALIAGNTIVYKPSELCPSVAELMVELYAQAGLPNGVLNMVQGARATGAAVLDHDDVDGVLFIGSPGTGQFIHKKFGGRPEIILALEMGGNNPLLIWDVEDVKNAANIAVLSSFTTSGQRCSCARRILVPSGAKGDQIIDAIMTLSDTIKIGAWDDEDIPFMGPLVSAEIATRVVDYAKALNGKVLREARILKRGSAYVCPGIIDVSGEINPDQEIFGPVMRIQRVDSFEAGIIESNNTKYGLSAGLVSDNRDLWPIFARKIRAGVVNFNRPTTGAAGSMPFGGPGLSGNHNPGAYYAADFCAWPMASQISDTLEAIAAKGLGV